MTDKSAGSALQRRPIKEVVAELGESWRIPVDALKECIERSDEAVPLLRDVVALAAVAWPNDDDRELLHRGLYVLANARDHATRQPLLRLLERCPEEILELFDGRPGKLSRIIESIFDGDREALQALILERSMMPLVRGAALVAGVRYVLRSRGWRSWLAELVEELDRQGPLAKDEYWLLAQLFTVMVVDDGDDIAENEPDPDREHGGGGRGDRTMEVDDEDDAESAEMRKGAIDGIDDVIASLKPGIDEGADRRSSRGSSRAVTRSWRGIGRNDPCPCGSGRKAKKCCWDMRDEE